MQSCLSPPPVFPEEGEADPRRGGPTAEEGCDRVVAGEVAVRPDGAVGPPAILAVHACHAC
jgi:hypothetical protein